jgi:mRNA-degrading endonuclease RelE of RelBE toxin-antitoxin system
MRFSIHWDEEALREMAELRAYDRQRVFDEAEKRLSATPDIEAGAVKHVRNQIPPWSSQPGFWQLTVVPFRVFYEMPDSEEVHIKSVRRKSRETTGGIL